MQKVDGRRSLLSSGTGNTLHTTFYLKQNQQKAGRLGQRRMNDAFGREHCWLYLVNDVYVTTEKFISCA